MESSFTAVASDYVSLAGQAPMVSTFAAGVSANAEKTGQAQRPSATITAGLALECFTIEGEAKGQDKSVT
jgi:hypothetical protein